MTVLFQYICHMSQAGAYVFAMVLIVRLFLRKCPRKYTYFLWLLVFLRFGCPVFPEGPFSLFQVSEVRIKAEIGVELLNRPDTSHNQFWVNSWSSFSRYYDGIFSPEVRDAILESDFWELFFGCP